MDGVSLLRDARPQPPPAGTAGGRWRRQRGLSGRAKQSQTVCVPSRDADSAQEGHTVLTVLVQEGGVLLLSKEREGKGARPLPKAAGVRIALGWSGD